MISTEYYTNPKYFELIRRSTGLLDEEKRFERIKEISIYNIILAAKCKITCVDEEEQITDWLILFATDKFEKQNDISSLFSLLVLGEYLVFAYIIDKKFNTKFKKNNIIHNYLYKNAEISEFLNYFYKKIPIDIAIQIFELLKNNGFKLDCNYYNSIFNLTEKESNLDYYKEMIQNNIMPNIETFNILISKSNEETAKYYYNELISHNLKPSSQTFILLSKKIRNNQFTNDLFNQVVDNIHINTEKSKISKVYYTAIQNSFDYEQVLSLFNEMKIKLGHLENFEKIEKSIELQTIAKLIQLSNDINIVEFWYKTAVEKYNKNLTIELYLNYIEKLSDENKIYQIIVENKDKFFPSSKKEKKRISILEQYNSVILKLLNKISNYSLLEVIIIEAIEKGIILNVFLLKNIIIKFDINILDNFIAKAIEINTEIQPSFWTNIIEEINEDKAIYIFKLLQRLEYNCNIIIYNALIKKASKIEFQSELLDQIEQKKLNADKYTFTPIFKRCITVKQLFSIIDECCKHKIDVDDTFKFVINSFSVSHINDFVETFQRNESIYFYTWNSEWFNLITSIYNDVINLKYVECIVTKIISSRIFVNILPENSIGSIYIGDLSSKKLNSIYDFEYNGKRIYIGQKLKAKIINESDIRGKNLSLK